MSALQFSVEWQDDAINAAPEEQATVADFKILLMNQNVTLHAQGDEFEDHLTVPLYGLAEGLAHNWWRLFGGRDGELSLIKFRNGYAIPDIRLRFDGGVFEVEARQFTYRNPDVRFLLGPPELMDRAAGEQMLTDFVEHVLSRLASRGLRNTSAALRWARVQRSRANIDEAAFCESAGALGLDPYKIDEAGAYAIEAAGRIFAGEPLTEFLSGSAGSDHRRLLDWIDTSDRRPRVSACIHELRPMAQQAAQTCPGRHLEKSWELGYRRAAALRDALCVDNAKRYHTYRQLAEAFGSSKSYTVAPAVDGLRALRIDHNDGVRIHMRSHGEPAAARTGHLFTFARAVGDVACFPEETTAPINDLHDAYRQSASRAFAAQFLAPIDEIRSMREDGRDQITMAGEFGVSTAVIEHQLDNMLRIETALAA
jgi:hypothetical protein